MAETAAAAGAAGAGGEAKQTPAQKAGVRSMGVAGVGAPAATGDRSSRAMPVAGGVGDTRGGKEDTRVETETKGDKGGGSGTPKLLRDGQDVSDQYVPTAALQERLGAQQRAQEKRLREAGLDPDTLKPLPAAGTGPAKEEPKPATVGAGAAAIPEPKLGTGQHDLWAEPNPKGKPDPNKAGELQPWDDEKEYYAAVARVEAHNGVVRERHAQASDAAAKDAETRQQEHAQREAERIQKYHAEDLPKFLADRKLTAEQYDRVLNAGPVIGSQQQRLLVAGWVMREATSMPEMLYELAQIPPGEQARIFALGDAGIVATLYRIDARLAAGLTWDGKPRQNSIGVDTKNEKGDKGSNGTATGAGGAANARGRISESPPQTGAGASAATDGRNLTGADRHKWRERQDADAREERIRRRQQSRTQGGRRV